MSDPATIFIVDDDMKTRESVKVMLQIAGFTVNAYTSCRNFIENFQKSENGCLILDLYLQNMDDPDPGVFLKKRGVDVPVVLMTRSGDSTSPSQFSDTDTLALFEKPIDYHRLLTTVSAIVR